jgi:purine nucleosidase
MCVALDPGVCTSVGRHYVDVEVSSELTRGMTVVDKLGVVEDERNRAVWRPVIDRVPPAQVVWTIDNGRWKQALYSALSDHGR